jgi:hypothetical protein
VKQAIGTKRAMGYGISLPDETIILSEAKDLYLFF